MMTGMTTRLSGTNVYSWTTRRRLKDVLPPQARIGFWYSLPSCEHDLFPALALC